MAELKKGDLTKFIKTIESSGFVTVYRRGSVYELKSALDPRGFDFLVKQKTDNVGRQIIAVSVDSWDDGTYHWRSFSMEKLREMLREDILLEVDTMIDKW